MTGDAKTAGQSEEIRGNSRVQTCMEEIVEAVGRRSNCPSREYKYKDTFSNETQTMGEARRNLRPTDSRLAWQSQAEVSSPGRAEGVEGLTGDAMTAGQTTNEF